MSTTYTFQAIEVEPGMTIMWDDEAHLVTDITYTEVWCEFHSPTKTEAMRAMDRALIEVRL